VAKEWLFNLLKAELENRGQGESAEYLQQILRLVPSAKTAALTGNSISLTLQQRISEYEVRLNSQTGELISWFADFLSTNGDLSMPPNEALALAGAVATPPKDAELEVAGYETMADRSFFRARWIHRVQGLIVEGDYIEVLINGAARRPFSVSRIWRQPNLTPKPREL
jgi:hypothetical protein